MIRSVQVIHNLIAKFLTILDICKKIARNQMNDNGKILSLGHLFPALNMKKEKTPERRVLRAVFSSLLPAVLTSKPVTAYLNKVKKVKNGFFTLP